MISKHMKIESLKTVFPSRRVTNQDIINMIRKDSTNYGGDLESALKGIKAMLRFSGARERRWLNEKEKPIELLGRAVDSAIQESGLPRESIDTVIYTGVDRAFIEPANAYFVANSLNMPNARCFDIADACMSWSTALQILQGMFKQGCSKRALVVNAEFNQTHENWIGYPKIFNLTKPEQIEYTFPGYTVGEATTATLLSADNSQEWEFHFKTRSDLAHLCTAATIGADNYITNTKGIRAYNQFVSFGREMHEHGTPEVIDIFKKLKCPIREIKAIFPHTSSKKAWEDVAKKIDVNHLMHFLYPEYGNIVSASVPAGLSIAIEQGRVRRGDRVAGWVGSAGMSFSAYSFTY